MKLRGLHRRSASTAPSKSAAARDAATKGQRIREAGQIIAIFAIMLTQQQTGGFKLFFNRQSIWALAASLAVAVLLTIFVVSSKVLPKGTTAHNPNVHSLSSLLFNRYVFPFELISLVLLAAMVGAILLARKGDQK